MRHRIRLSILSAFGLVGTLLVPGAVPVSAVVDATAPVFINELHYDNDGADVGEFVEVAGPAGTDLSGWSIELYNGNGGARYATVALSGTIPDQDNGFGTVSVARAGIQNGSPDGLALVAPSGLVEFLSYEGAFTAVDGPAAGATSTDIGVSEVGTTPVGESLSKTGTGSLAGDFAWQAPAAESPGAVNAGQTFGAVAAPPFISEIHYDNEGTDIGEFVEIEGPAGTDLTGWSLAPYNGNGGAQYSVTALSGSIDDEGAGRGAVSFAITGLQNGSPDGVALVDGTGAVVEFLSYEGSFTATDGPAAGLTSTDIGVAEVSSTPIGQSLQLIDGAWTGPAAESPGQLNTEFVEPPQTVRIHEVQGSGPVAALDGQAVTVQGIVTALFTRDDVLDGFFVQEEDADADTDATTSEGVFIFCRFGNGCPAVAAGDLVTVVGTVTEFFGMTQIDTRSGSIAVDSSGNPLPSAVAVDLPAAGSTADEDTFENVEGMLATFPDTLVVSEYFELARFGQVVLTEAARPYQFTHLDAPSVAGYDAFLADLETRRIILDDDNNDQNDAIFDGPDEAYYYPTGGLSVGNRFRGGDTVTGLTGVMHWSFAGQGGTDAWRIRPIQGVDYTFESANLATSRPADVGGSITAASFNVLNLFSTIDVTSSNSVGDCGPSGTQDCRGADSDAELARQQVKIAAAITTIDADIVGLIELENDGDDASASDLVSLLNAATAPGTYDYLATGFLGDDAIKVGVIYQPAQVTPVGDFAILDSSVDPRFLDSKNRPMLVQTFVENDTAAQVTVAVNHLKSKGSGCDDVGDPDRDDGQGSCPGTRTAAAEAIVDFLATDPTNAGDTDVLLLGDLNSYAMEDSIMALRDAGYTDLLDAFVGPDAYTYVFDGQLGYLDYALANSTLVSQVTGATAWHINADEIPVFDYNDDVRDAGEASFERESGVLPVYAPDPLRSSDHDPVIVGLDLEIDPAFAIATLIERVDALEADGALNKGQANSLRRSLGSAIRQLDRGRANAAVGILTGVISQLEDFVDDGVLTADEAALLLPVVTALRDQIA